MDQEKTVMRELMLIKVNADTENRSQIQDAVSVFRAKVVDLSPDSMTMEITGEKSKLDAFIAYLTPYGISELCRTGMTAIGRGDYILQKNN
jgi:acetolactate synthase-1/3 small subunit